MPYVKHPLIKEKSVEARVYQQVLAARVLERGNSLVVAPTALGKTIVALLLSAELLQKHPKKKILFLAPTKPLAVQHQKSFKKFLKIDEEKIELLTGTITPKKRTEIWDNSQIITATPQTIENDLLRGRIDLEEVSLLIFDESHRAVGDYAYVFIAKRYMKQNKKPLILAITASPGSGEEKIQDVCKNLFIKNLEIKKDSDEDVKPYVQEIKTEWIRVNLPEKFLVVKKNLEIFMKEQLISLKRIGFAPKSKYMNMKDLLEIQRQIRRDIPTQARTRPSLFTAASKIAALIKITHANTLLETQGVSSLNDYFERMKTATTKAAKSLLRDEGIGEAIIITKKLNDANVIHPKLLELEKILVQQFKANSDGKVIVFNHYRDSIRHMAKYLKNVKGVKAKRFVGQAAKSHEKGMTQKEQIATIKDLKDGKYNTLLASSVAEEGLDIPAVDLVVFYEPVPSEIRMIQRRGRTGRFGKGRVIVLIAKDTRDEGFYWAARAKEKKMHNTIKVIQKTFNGQKLDSQTTLGKYMAPEERVLVWVDSREGKSSIASILEEKNAMVKVRTLEVGDFMLSDDVIVERKTVEDFLSSMVDGRLFNQLVLLSSNCNSPLLLLEGSIEDLFALRDIHENAIRGALISIATNYRVPIIFTRDINETAQYLITIAKREQLAKDKDIRLRVGRKGLTLAEQQRFIVESFPSIGPTLAKALLGKFGSIKSIVEADEKKLREVEKMGPKKAKKIIDVLRSKWEKD